MDGANPAKKPVILVVEDDDQTALFIRHFLEREGYEVRHAADGREAAALIGQSPPPDLMTLDSDLPHASGDELLLQVKTTPGWERVPVVMVTAKPKDAQATWAVKTGSKAYLVKPFKPEDLLECVGRLLRKKSAG